MTRVQERAAALVALGYPADQALGVAELEENTLAPVRQFVAREDDWLCCACGNRPDVDGFYPCLDDGTVVSPTVSGPWQGRLYVCASCGRIYDQYTRAVTGQRDPEGIIEEMNAAEGY